MAQQLMDTIAQLRAELSFTSARRTAPPVAVDDFDALSKDMQHLLANEGDAELFVHGEQRNVRRIRPGPPQKASTVRPGQVGGGARIREALHFEGGRPVWSRTLIEQMVRVHDADGLSLSPPDYPHAAEDLSLACKRWLLPHGHSWRSHVRMRVGIFSSISPWVELTMLQCLGHDPSSTPAPLITTVDYNPPLIDSETTSRWPLRVADHASLARTCSSTPAGASRAFDVAVAFSGIEHDGLGRYGDSINPWGDMHAMHEIAHCLGPSSRLLLAVPTCARDTLYFPAHRIYGPHRLPRLLQNFTLIGRVWANQSVVGGLEKASAPPTLWTEACSDWQHQHVLVLEKRVAAG